MQANPSGEEFRDFPSFDFVRIEMLYLHFAWKRS